eukprot:TRINITY_DN1415_c0_g1_i1.p1 TRINITY_DN1415_c0_g1~~TRINITY_DN1415_c0_g1_i1.p1  ORF type:complete len:431 (-),score=144.01 TRINITY_DN1415_c0_g1_i1:7-1299(-)
MEREGSITDQRKRLGYAIVEYFQKLIREEGATNEAYESLEVATQCISSALGVDVSNEQEKKQFSVAPLDLLSVFQAGCKSTITQEYDNTLITLPPEHRAKFDSYLKTLESKHYFETAPKGSVEYSIRLKRALDAFLQRNPVPSTSSPSTTSPTSNKPVSKEDAEKADKLKIEGNQQLSEGNAQAAINSYTQGLALNPTNHILYSNRAAAYSKLNNHQAAIADCQACIRFNSSYSKAYSRLGLSYYSLGDFESAITAYKKCLELDPSNATATESLEHCKQKLNEKAVVNNNNNNNNNAAGAGAGAGLGGMGGLGAGGMEKLFEMMNNGGLNDLLQSQGGILEMTKKMAENPAMMQMLNNPAMIDLAQNMVQQNPGLMQQMASVFGDPATAAELMNSPIAQQAAALARARGENVPSGFLPNSEEEKTDKEQD